MSSKSKSRDEYAVNDPLGKERIDPIAFTSGKLNKRMQTRGYSCMGMKWKTISEDPQPRISDSSPGWGQITFPPGLR